MNRAMEKAVRLELDPLGRLVARFPSGAVAEGLVPVRCFPFSAPGELIALCDVRGHEVWCVDRLEELDPASRELLLAELARREFVPELHRILSISPGPEPTQWEVETDRGKTCIRLPNEDCVRRLEPDGALIIDDCGIRYRVGSLRQLDGRSRKLLRRYL
jgi:hypothetical protein